MASRNPVHGSPASMAVWTTAITSPASGPNIVNPRMRSLLASRRIFMKPRVSPRLRARRTEVIGSRTTRTSAPFRSASLSFNPTRPSSGSMKAQYGTIRSIVVRVPPARLSRTTRKSSKAACALAHGPNGGRACLETVVDLYVAACIKLHPRAVKPNVPRIRFTASGDEHVTALHRLLACRRPEMDVHSVTRTSFNRLRFGAQDDVDPVLLKDRADRFGNIRVLTCQQL